MKQALLATLACVAVGCTSVSVDSKPPVRSQGLGSDLRIFFDDACLPPPPPPPIADGPDTRTTGNFLADLAIEAGTMLFKTFGKMVQEAGAPKADRSMAVRGGFMFVTTGESLEFNRKVGCIHVIRGAFGGGAENFAGASPAMAGQWRKLGLKSTPSLYALVRVMPMEESRGYMRGELLNFIVPNFERTAPRGERDYLLVLEFERPKAEAYVTQNDDGTFAYAETGAFARGVFKLTSIRENVAFDEAALAGFDTGLMPVMAKGGENDSGAFNLFVDVIEFKRGDPQLADLAAVLRDDDIVASAKSAITRIAKPEAAERKDAAEDFTAMNTERSLIRTLDTQIRAIRALLANAGTDDEDLIAAIDDLDDASFAVKRREAEHGWSSPEKPKAKLDTAEGLIKQAQAKVDQP